MSLLVSRENIHIEHAIIGSSDMDQAPKWLAKLETAIMLPLLYPLISGQKCFMRKKIDKKLNAGGQEAESMKQFMKIMGMDGSVDHSFMSKESVKNQFYTDLYTKVGEHIQVSGTTIHVFYAKKMGKKYLQRYHKYFADPDIHTLDLKHEQLLLDADRWTKESVMPAASHTLSPSDSQNRPHNNRSGRHFRKSRSGSTSHEAD